MAIIQSIDTRKRLDARAMVTVPQDPADARVNSASPAYARMRERWDEGIDDFLDGDDWVQSNHGRHLPQYPAERPLDYIRRVTSTVLLPGFKDAVERIAVRPFAKPVRVVRPTTDDGDTVELPEPLDRIERNVDGKGSDLTSLAKRLFFDGVARGPCFLWVDAPGRPEGTTPQQVEELRLWPRIKRINPRHVIGWTEDENAAGDPVVTSVRFLEERTEAVGRYGTEEVPYVRELWAPGADENGVTVPGGWASHRWDKGLGEFVEVESGSHEFDRLPLLWAQFGEPNGLVECRPPLYQVFRMNLAHLRSQSRQTQYVESVRIATRFLAGATDEEIKAGLEIGPNQMKGSVNSEAKLTFCEHTGAAAQTGWDDLDRWQLAMAVAGTEPLRTKTGNPTATGKAIETAKSSCDVESWVRLLEHLLEEAYRMCARWLGLELPEGWQIDIWTEFSLGLRADTDLPLLLAMAEKGYLSGTTLIQETQRRDVISDRIDAGEEMDRVEEEAKARAAAFGEGVDFGDDGEPEGEGQDPAGAAA